MNNKNAKQQEALRARLGIRDLFVQNAISEIYDNVCQSLTVARFRLAVPENRKDEQEMENLVDVLAQAMKDLRGVCKGLTPDMDVKRPVGFKEVVQKLVTIVVKDPHTVVVKGEPGKTDYDQKMILLDILSEILISVSIDGRKFIELELAFESNRWLITVKYRGPAIDPTMAHTKESDCIANRIGLADAELNISENGHREHCLQLIASV